MDPNILTHTCLASEHGYRPSGHLCCFFYRRFTALATLGTFFFLGIGRFVPGHLQTACPVLEPFSVLCLCIYIHVYIYICIYQIIYMYVYICMHGRATLRCSIPHSQLVILAAS